MIYPEQCKGCRQNKLSLRLRITSLIVPEYQKSVHCVKTLCHRASMVVDGCCDKVRAPTA